MQVEGRTKQNRELADPEQNAQETKRSLIWFARSSQMQVEGRTKQAQGSQLADAGRTKQKRELADPEQNAQETRRSLIWFARSSQMQVEQNRRENKMLKARSSQDGGEQMTYTQSQPRVAFCVGFHMFSVVVVNQLQAQ